MNRLFYIFCTFCISVILIVIISNNPSSNNHLAPNSQNNKTPIIEKNTVKKTEIPSPSINTTELNKHSKITKTSPNKAIEQSLKCIINNGKVLTDRCNQYKYINSMDLDKYTNLELHDQPKSLESTDKKAISLGKFVGKYELGISDQGKIYQFIFFDHCQETENLSYFLNSTTKCMSITATESDFTIKEEDINGFEGVNLQINNGFNMTMILASNQTKCIGSTQYKLHIENNLNTDSFMQCSEQSQFINDNYVTINDPIIAKCIFGNNYIEGNTYSVDPTKVIALNCGSLIEVDIFEIGQFINLEYLAVTQLGEDVSFLNNFPLLKSFVVENNSSFDLNTITHLTNLTTLIITNSKIINASSFNIGNIQLSELDLSHSTLENLNFLEYQNNLKRVDLSYMELKNVPIIGNGSNLTYLNLKSNDIKNIDGLVRYTDLEILNISQNDIEIMSSLPLNNGVLKSVETLGNPLDCDDPLLVYSPAVKSRCNFKLKKNR